MMGAAGVTEELKARDPMRWVGLMNTLKAQVEEIILTELTVGQVAQTVGYSTSSRFAELFRKSTGLLPLEYRKNAQRK